MPKDKQIKKVLVIGSGPIVIGQAAEFDYAGTQACLTLKNEGCEVVLINNNPATIMTDENVADKVYFEPLTVENIEQIIIKEKPDGILVSVSGQTGLNLAFKLSEELIFEKYNLRVLGTSIASIKQGEDREKFRDLMEEIKEPTPDSLIVDNKADAIFFSEEVGFPIIIRPAYTLGGSGGGIASNMAEFTTLVSRGLRASPIHQCLIERSIAGWKEIEFEMIRDANNTAIVVCHMENIDPVGVHTGDSIVVAPIQTLKKAEIQKLRDASINIVQQLGIVGACNVQLAFDPVTKDYMVIEVNPRVSRSSALASKATGYPIAKIATKLSLGYTLDELDYEFKNETLATYEPTFDYVVVKFPCFPFDKLTSASRLLGTQMKATGEVMAIEQTVAAGVQKAVRSLELETNGLSLVSLETKSNKALEELLVTADDRRFFAILELLRRGVSVKAIADLTKIARFFLEEFARLVMLENVVKAVALETVTSEQLFTMKQAGFTNDWLADVWNCLAADVAHKLNKSGIFAHYGKINAYSKIVEEKACYYYAMWQHGKPEAVKKSDGEKIVIVGSGPIKIGQGVEFDYCSVQGVKALQKYGYETILINNNPATVSTDYELADKLYFEPITAEDVLHVLRYEAVNKVIIQFGGQTSLNLVDELEAAGVELLGSQSDVIDTLEDRDRFYKYVQSIDVPHIPGLMANSKAELIACAAEIKYPVLVRPSYVIGGRGMEIIRTDAELEGYAAKYLQENAYPILLDAYFPGKEVEVDVVTDGERILIPAIFEHLEKAGVHSGDSMAVTPPVSLSAAMKKQIVTYTERIACGINFKGIFNIQFVIFNDILYVLEVNPRASRTVPITSKVTGVDLIELATGTLLGKTLTMLGSNVKILPENDFYTVKAPVFSTNKLTGVDPLLVPEMKSTGELIAISKTFIGSLTKAFIWNEQLQRAFKESAKELLVMDESFDVTEIAGNLRDVQFAVKSLVDFKDSTIEVEAWMKSAPAFAVYSTGESSEERMRALEFNLFVMTAVETVQAFSKITDEKLAVIAIQDIEKANQKKVVCQ